MTRASSRYGFGLLAWLAIAAPAAAQVGSGWVNAPVIAFPAIFINGAGVANGPILCTDGTAAAPSCGAFASEPGLGIYKGGTGTLTFANDNVSGTIPYSFGVTGQQFGSAMLLSWSSTTSALGSADVSLARDAANSLAQRNGVNAQTFNLYNTFTDASNFERLTSFWAANVALITTSNAGTGSARPLRFGTGGAAKWSLETNNNFIGLTATGGIGYGTGAGGTVTQATSKATGVTLNTVTGQITMNGAALANGVAVTFVLTDSAIAANDLVIVQHYSGGTAAAYLIQVSPNAGSANITIRNITAGSLSEAIVLQFAIIKGAIS